MTIAAVGAVAFTIPYRTPLSLACGTVAEHRGVLVTVTDEQGLTGNGELAPGPGTAASKFAAIAAAARRAMPALRGIAVDSGRDVRSLRERLAPELRPGCEAALLDLAGQRTGRPLHQLLGSRPGGPATVRVNAMIDRSTPEVALAASRVAIAAGYSTLKIKVDRRGLEPCIELLGVLRRDYGSRLSIRLDCNGSWSLAEAVDALHALERFDLEYVEQPVRSLSELAQLRARSTVAIAADESVADLGAICTALDLEAADVLIVKPARLGLIDAIEAARLADGAGVRVVVTSNLDTSLGCAAALHLAGAIAREHVVHAHGLGTVATLGGDLCRADDSLIPHSGQLAIPSTAGCGVRVDSAQIELWRSK